MISSIIPLFISKHFLLLICVPEPQVTGHSLHPSHSLQSGSSQGGCMHRLFSSHSSLCFFLDGHLSSMNLGSTPSGTTLLHFLVRRLLPSLPQVTEHWLHPVHGVQVISLSIGQLRILQFFFSVSSPGQVLWEHFLVRMLIPRPQVFVHLDHCDQGSHSGCFPPK